MVWASLTNSGVLSSSVTETTDTPTQMGSPVSSHTTSLSVASTKDAKDMRSSKEVDVMSAEEISSNIPLSAEKTIHHIDSSDTFYPQCLA